MPLHENAIHTPVRASRGDYRSHVLYSVNANNPEGTEVGMPQAWSGRHPAPFRIRTPRLSTSPAP